MIGVSLCNCLVKRIYEYIFCYISITEIRITQGYALFLIRESILWHHNYVYNQVFIHGVWKNVSVYIVFLAIVKCSINPYVLGKNVTFHTEELFKNSVKPCKEISCVFFWKRQIWYTFQGGSVPFSPLKSISSECIQVIHESPLSL